LFVSLQLDSLSQEDWCQFGDSYIEFRRFNHKGAWLLEYIYTFPNSSRERKLYCHILLPFKSCGWFWLYYTLSIHWN